MYSNDENFSLGTIVNHELFGTGAVIDVDGDLLKIAFKDGVKTISKNHKSLTKEK